MLVDNKPQKTLTDGRATQGTPKIPKTFQTPDHYSQVIVHVVIEDHRGSTNTIPV